MLDAGHEAKLGLIRPPVSVAHGIACGFCCFSLTTPQLARNRLEPAKSHAAVTTPQSAHLAIMARPLDDPGGHRYANTR
jgi:hypothetical protein